MSRFIFSAAVTAALLSTTAQVCPQALADALPLDSFPFDATQPPPAHKKKPAVHVPAEGELVPLELPREASAKSRHHKSARGTVTDVATLNSVDKATPAPAPLAAALAAAPPTFSGERIIRLAGGAPPAAPSAASPPVVSAAPGPNLPTQAAVHPLKPGLTTATQPVAAPFASAADAAIAPMPTTIHPTSTAMAAPPSNFVTANAANANPSGAGVSPDLVDALPYGVSLARPQTAAGNTDAVPPAMTGQQTAQPPARNVISPVRNTLTLEAGLGRVIELAGNTSSVFAADPKVAEVRPASATSLFVFGVAAGRTTIAALDSGGHPVAQYDVVVLPSAYGAASTRSSLAHVLPGHNLHLDQLGNGLQVDGAVASPAEAERAMSVARGFLNTGESASNRLNVNANVQVNLKVRIAEMSRSVTRDLGLNWSAMADIGKVAVLSAYTGTGIQGLTQVPGYLQGISHGGGVDAVLEALAQDQLIHSLAEPNLTAMSGETASFLVGGEFPIPVAQQNNQTTIEFKQYGVSLAFVPTVLSEGHISLKVRPEVSQLTTQGAITLSSTNSSFQIPALSVRRAETTVELGSGQSFAIAGLLQDATTISDSAVPFLGEVPILGALFRSDAFLRNETELVIIVTPYIVRPTSNPKALSASTDGVPVPNDYERLVLTHQVGGQPPPRLGSGAGTPATGGFVVQ